MIVPGAVTVHVVVGAVPVTLNVPKFATVPDKTVIVKFDADTPLTGSLNVTVQVTELPFVYCDVGEFLVILDTVGAVMSFVKFIALVV